jgi:hypothetical protein
MRGTAYSPVACDGAQVEAPILLTVTVLMVLLFQRHALHRAAETGLLALYRGYIGYVVARGR